MSNVIGNNPTGWKESGNTLPTRDFSFLRGTGVSGGGSTPQWEEFRDDKRGQLGRDTAKQDRDNKGNIEEIDDILQVEAWNQPFLDIGEVLPGTLNRGDIAAGTITADRIQVQSLAAISANVGQLVIEEGGFIRSGQTAFNTGTGFFLGNVGGVQEFSIGDPAGSSLTFTTATGELLINGDTVNAETQFQLNGQDVNSNAGTVNGATKAGQSFLLDATDMEKIVSSNTNDVWQFTLDQFQYDGYRPGSSSDRGYLHGLPYSGYNAGSYATNIFTNNPQYDQPFEIGCKYTLTTDTSGPPTDQIFGFIGFANVFWAKNNGGTVYSGVQAGTYVDAHVGFFIGKDAQDANQEVFASVADGVTETRVLIPGVNISDGVDNKYVIISDGGGDVLFYVNGVLEATISTNVPTGNMNTDPFFFMGQSTTVTTAVSVRFTVFNPYVLVTFNE